MSVSCSICSESPKRGRSFSPISARDADNRHRRTDDWKELAKDSGRSQHGRSDSHRASDRQSSRYDKHGAEDDRDYYRSSRSGRESRGGTRSDRESDYTRSRDYVRDADKYAREKYDSPGHRSRDKDRETSHNEHQRLKDITSERSGSGRRHGYSSREETERDRHTRDWDARDEKRDYHRTAGDYRNDRSHDDSRGHRRDLDPRRDDSGLRLKDVYKSDNREDSRDNERHRKEPTERSDNKTLTLSETQDSPAKKPKFYSLGKGIMVIFQ